MPTSSPGGLRDQPTHPVRGVLAAGRLHTVLQPVVALHDRTIVGYEALARFPEGAAPGWAIEEWFEQAAGIGEGAALEVLALCTALERRVELPPGAFLSVNVSAALIDAPPIQAAFMSAAPLDDVVIELTEHREPDSIPRCRHAIDVLRAFGARAAIDDIGVRHAGLSWILELEPDLVKIDYDIIHGLARDERRRGTVQAMVMLGERLGFEVVAEGIETAEDIAALVELAVPFGQGYLLGRPGDAPRPLDPAIAWPEPVIDLCAPNGPRFGEVHG